MDSLYIASSPALGDCVCMLYQPSISAERRDWSNRSSHQRLSQDLETGCLKLAVVKSLGVQIFKGDHNILIFQP